MAAELAGADAAYAPPRRGTTQSVASNEGVVALVIPHEIDKPMELVVLDYTGEGGETAIMEGGVPAEARVEFAAVDELPKQTQFWLSCGLIPDLELVKQLAVDEDVDRLARSEGVRLTAVEWACRMGRADVARWLIDPRGGGIGATEGMPLMWAAYAGEIKLVKELAALGADPSATNAKGEGALHYAAATGQADVCRWLVEDAGVDPSVQDKKLWTALQHAREAGHKGVAAAKYLVGVTPDTADAIRSEASEACCDGCELKPAPGKKLQRCARCRSALYCSPDCQRRAWKVHKILCRPKD